jgi:uncharacterized protein (DUF1778 family)
MVATKAKSSRWNLRVDPGEDIVVRRAAAEAKRELSEFVRTAAVAEAERVLADRTVFELDAERWERFAAALDRPPRVPAGLRELFSRPSVFESPAE